MTERIMKVAESISKSRLAMVLEGGYNLTALSETISSIISTMAKIDQPNISKLSSLKEVTLDNEIESRIEQLKIILRNYWKIFR